MTATRLRRRGPLTGGIHPVPLIKGRRSRLLHSLTKSIRLVLPADPGLERMLEAVRLYSPAARKAAGGIILVDGEHFALSAVTRVDSGLAVEAGLPADITAAYFPSWTIARHAGETSQDIDKRKRRYQAQSACLLGGLAARFDGLWSPRPPDISRPLHADVYLPPSVTAAQIPGLIAAAVPELAGAQARGLDDRQMISMIAARERGEETQGTSKFGVIGFAGGGLPFEVEFWPAEMAMLSVLQDRDGGRLMAALGELRQFRMPGTSMLVVRAAQPAAGADPAVARAVGTAALRLAAQGSGVCLDIFGFAVRRPEDLTFRDLSLT
jgi:hypothetical protein